MVFTLLLIYLICLCIKYVLYIMQIQIYIFACHIFIIFDEAFKSSIYSIDDRLFTVGK